MSAETIDIIIAVCVVMTLILSVILYPIMKATAHIARIDEKVTKIAANEEKFWEMKDDHEKRIIKLESKIWT